MQVPPRDAVICGSNLGEEGGKEAQEILRIITMNIDLSDPRRRVRERDIVLRGSQV